MPVLAVGAVLAITPAAGHAADFAVETTADGADASVGDGTCSSSAQGGACTLRAAIQEANAAGGASTVKLPAGRYVLAIAPIPQAGSAADKEASNGDLDLNADIALRGAGVGRTVVDGGRIDRVFETGSGTSVEMSDLTITGGDATANGSQEIDLGGGILNRSAITIDRVELVDNLADGGGGMFSIPRTMPVIRDSLVTGNAAFEGGGLRIDSGAMIINTTITGNRLRVPEPGDLAEKPVAIVIPLVDEISGYGGGIDHRGGAELAIVNSTIVGNHALKGGGGIGAGQGYTPVSDQLPLGRVTLHNTIVAGNTSDAGPLNCRTNEVPFESMGHNIDTDGSCFLTAAGDLAGRDPLLAPLAGNGGPRGRTRCLPAARRSTPAMLGAARRATPAVSRGRWVERATSARSNMPRRPLLRRPRRARARSACRPGCVPARARSTSSPGAA